MYCRATFAGFTSTIYSCHELGARSLLIFLYNAQKVTKRSFSLHKISSIVSILRNFKLKATSSGELKTFNFFTTANLCRQNFRDENVEKWEQGIPLPHPALKKNEISQLSITNNWRKNIVIEILTQRQKSGPKPNFAKVRIKNS